MQQMQTPQEIKPSDGRSQPRAKQWSSSGQPAQPFSGTESGATPRALCNAPSIYMCYKSQEQIGQVA